MALLMFLVLTQAGAQAQTDSGQQPGDNSQAAGTPSASPDQPSTPTIGVENPPLTGLDAPGLETNAAPRSFLVPGVELSEALDSNIGSQSASAAVHSATRLLGSLAVQRFWSKYEVAADYVGGGAFYNTQGVGAQQVHSVEAEGRRRWQTGQLALREVFSYLPEGSFGFGAYGGAGAYGGYRSALGGLGFGLPAGGFGGQLDFFGASQFGSLGQEPRISNTALADIVEDLSPRSSITVAGSYGLVHFTDNPLNLIDSRQTSAQVGYNYEFTRRDQIAVLYGFQSFHFPSLGGAETFNTNLINLLYGHRISGRLDFVIGGGPQITRINDPFFGHSSRVSGSGRASLRYHFPKASVGLSYDHYNTSGSGFFAGARTDVAHATLTRPVGRKWDGMLDIGYAHNKRLQQSFLGINADSSTYGYAGGALRRQLGREFGAFLSYQFNYQVFDSSFCGAGNAVCNRISNRHVLAVGLDWHPRPIRLD